MKKPSTIFHLVFKATGADHYFGSIAAIYDTFSAKEIGVSASRLYDFDIDENRPYKNKICIIKKSELLRKPGNRRRVKKVTKINVTK